MGNTGAVPVIKPARTIDVMVMRIVTRFTTVDEFVSAFRKFCGEGTCFIPSAHAKRIGIETGFSIRLADGTPMLRGLCVVLDSWSTNDNPYERPGVRLGIRSLTAESKPVFQRLLLAGAAAKPIEDDHARATVEMPPLFPEERAPHSEFILPANPLTEMSDESLAAFVDCMMFEDAIPEVIGAHEASGETRRIDDDRNDPNTRRVEITERLEEPRAFAVAASTTRLLDGGTQRIEKLESPQDKAQELADEHADTAFGPMLAKAAARIQPVADHTQPTRMPFDDESPVIGGAAFAAEPMIPAPPILPDAPQADAVTAPPVAVTASVRPTILGVAPIANAAPRNRISMPAITDPSAPPAVATPFPSDHGTTDLIPRPPVPRGMWWRLTTKVRTWYKKLVWARRRRVALRR